MARRKANQPAQPEGPPEGFVLGSEISISALQYGEIAITPHGRATAYLGYMKARNDSSFLFRLSVAERELDGRKSHRFLSLEHGMLSLERFLWDTSYYKILEDRRLRLPTGPHNEYGVFHLKSWEEDVELSRQLFGATQTELDEFLIAYHSAVRYEAKVEYGLRPGRTTFSRSRDNRCDLTGQFIPKEFPFIVLVWDTTYFGGHLSLYGFYRHLALSCHYHQHGEETRGERFFNSLVECGARPELIIQMCKAAFAGHGLEDPDDALRLSEQLLGSRRDRCF